MDMDSYPFIWIWIIFFLNKWIYDNETNAERTYKTNESIIFFISKLHKYLDFEKFHTPSTYLYRCSVFDSFKSSHLCRQHLGPRQRSIILIKTRIILVSLDLSEYTIL